MIGTREPPQEPRRPAGGALLLLVVAILGGVAAVPCARADDRAGFRAHWWTPWALKSAAGAPLETSQGVRATFHRDMAQIASRRTLAILAAGGALAAVRAYLLGGVTAFGRVEEREHFPSDVVFGAALGLASGVAVVRSDAASSSLSIIVRPGAVGLTARF